MRCNWIRAAAVLLAAPLLALSTPAQTSSSPQVGSTVGSPESVPVTAHSTPQPLTAGPGQITTPTVQGGQLQVGGPDSLTTTFASTNFGAGSFFDITPSVNLRLSAIDVNDGEAVGTLIDIDVYYRVGSSVGHEENAGSWNLLAGGFGVSAARDNPTLVPLPAADFMFKAGVTYGIFVVDPTLPQAHWVTFGPPTVFANEDLCLKTQTASNLPLFGPGTNFPNFQFNGTLYYDTIPTLNVAIAGAEGNPAWLADVQSKLEATGKFNSIDILNVLTTTPSLSDLLRYDAVLTWTDSNYADPTAMGNNLADYVDAGGGVVMAVFANASIPIAGRWITDGYEVIVSGSGQTQGGGPFTLGTVNLPNHPVMKAVTSFAGGTSSYRPTATVLVPGASSICEWSDGRVLAAEGRPGRVDLAFFPPSSDSRADFWDSTTDGDLLMANALCAAADRKPRVLVAGSPNDPLWINDVQAKLVASDKFSVVDVFLTSTSIPTLAQLRSYAAVLTFTDGAATNLAAVGDVFADYVDAGGGVVSAMFETGSIPMGGRWSTGGYEVLLGVGQQSGVATLGAVHLPGHPIMNGVSSFNGGTGGYRPASATLAPGAVAIAEWSDGIPLVVEGANRQRVDLGFFPPSTDARGDFWDATTDGAELLCNSLLHVATSRPRIALVTADSSWVSDPQAKLQGTGRFATVDLVDARIATPSLATLRQYDAIMVWSNNSFLDPVALGDNVADYLDAGGGVVVNTFANSHGGGLQLQGRFLTGGHQVIVNAGVTTGAATLGTVSQPSHPVMAGVSSFSGGSSSYRPTGALNAGSTLIASWNTGQVLAAVGANPRRIDLGFFPVSSDSRADFWDATTDGTLLMANALTAASRGVGGEVGTTYCTAGTTFDGCHATISASGRPSVSKLAGFEIEVTNMPGNKNGILFYGLSGPNTAPWGNSTSFLCVKAPTQRMGLLSSGGAPGTCDGVFQLDWLDYVATHPNKLGVPFSPGCGVWVQAWFRDPAAGTGPVGAKGTATSNGLFFVTQP